MINKDQIANIINSKNELLLSLNDLIEKQERQLLNYFSDNVDQEDMHGDIDLPLVLKADYNHDYYKLKLLKQQYQMEIYNINKALENPYKYILVKMCEKYNNIAMTKTQRSILLDKEINLLIEKRKTLEDTLRLIDEDPKNYLRLQECRNSDFSAIKNENVRRRLEDMQLQLNIQYKKRRDVSNSINSLEDELNNQSVMKSI